MSAILILAGMTMARNIPVASSEVSLSCPFALCISFAQFKAADVCFVSFVLIRCTFSSLSSAPTVCRKTCPSKVGASLDFPS